MLFPSITFLYFFLPVSLLLYAVMPEKGKNAVLFGTGILFYFWGEPLYTFLLLAMVLAGYAGGRSLAAFTKCGRKTACKILLGSLVAAVVFTLGFFKYGKIAAGLPLGISFYSFQVISYLVDVYRKEPEEKSFLDFGAYLTFFPQLIAGPIVRYGDMRPQLKQKKKPEHFWDGTFRFFCGLAKKLLIGDVLGEFVAELDAMSGKGTFSYWVLAAAYVLQLYYDFSGYSDMAIGMGQMFGFHLPENFRYPLTSKSITEFWRRWHMTLGSFLRDYLYIPLGGNRVGVLRWCFNVLLVWAVSGMWHGAGVNFLLWGVLFGVVLILEKLVKTALSKQFGERFRPYSQSFLVTGLRHMYALVVLTLSFVLFRIEDMGELFSCLGAMFGQEGNATNALFWYELKNYGVILFFACIGATPLLKHLAEKWVPQAARKALCQWGSAVLLVLVTAFLLGSQAHPFLYFRF